MNEDIDPDVVAAPEATRRPRFRDEGPVLAVIGIGGALGAVARAAVSSLLPHDVRAFAWSTFLTNVSGCFLIAVVMVCVTEIWTPHRLLRPFLAPGVLGGYTTFSTFTLDARSLLASGQVLLGLGYLAATLLGALLSVVAGLWLTRATASRR